MKAKSRLAMVALRRNHAANTLAVSAVIFTAASSFAVPIDVPSFGPMFSNSAGYVNKSAGQTFGDAPTWTVSTGYNGYGNVNVVGNGWQSPDGNATVEMDGQGPPGQISTIINVPQNGIVTISFWLAGDPIYNPGSADTQPKYLEVQLGSGVGLGPAVTNTFDATGMTLSSMGWVYVSDSFVAVAGLNTLTFSSLDFPGYDFSNGSDAGPAIGTVSAFETTSTPAPTAPDNTSSLILLSLASAGLFCLSRRIPARI